MRHYRPLIATFLLCLFVSACTPDTVEVVSENDEKQYQLAKSYQEQGRVDEALSAFLRVIDARRDAPESHLEAGYIYLHKMKDPVSAIYHFKRYMQLKPDSKQAAQVQQLIETAQKEFARQLPAHPYEGQLDRLDLMELMQGLKRENESLKRDLVAAQKRVQQLEGLVGGARRSSSSGLATGETRQPLPTVTRVPPQAQQPQPQPSPPNAASAPRSYTVQSGDTLSRISTKVYGTPSRWIDIYQANRDRLSSENALRVGQELRIP